MTDDLRTILKKFEKSKNFGTAGSISVALVVTNHAKEMGLPLNPNDLLTPSGTQVLRLGKEQVQRILARHGISDIFSMEAGRTSRGSVANMREYVSFLNSMNAEGQLDLELVESFWVEVASQLIAAKKKDTENFSYSAVPLEQNQQRFYFTTIPVSALFPYCFVARRNEDPKTGFQRRLNQSRAEDIAKYLHDGQGSIPTNIVLSAQPDAGVEYNSRSKVISYQRSQGAFLVLDGQHRLWGYEICRNKYGSELRVPVSIYIGLTRAEEARLFIDINTTQVGVPSALLLDIKQIAEIESSGEQVLRALFDDLNLDHESPLRKLLSPAKSVTGKISRVTFNKAMMPVIRANVWANTSRQSRYQLFLNYIRAVQSVLDEKSVFVRAAFFESICEVFDDVIQTSISKNNDAKEPSIREILEPLSSVDFSVMTENSKPTKSTYLSVIKAALQKNISISDAMV